RPSSYRRPPNGDDLDSAELRAYSPADGTCLGVAGPCSREGDPADGSMLGWHSLGEIPPGPHGALPHDFLDLSEPWFRDADLRPLRPVSPFRHRLERPLKLLDPASNVRGKLLRDPPFSEELSEHLSRLLEVLGRLVPESPIVSEEIRDMSGIDSFPIAVRLFLHVVAEEEHEQIHEILPANLVDLQL